MKKHVDLTNVLAAMVLSTTLTYGYWGQPDPRGLVMFCVFLVLAEVFVYSRWRNAISCKLCGFDPVIYKRSPEQASRRVRQFFEERANDPQFMLSRSPLVEVQRRRREKERREQQIKRLEAKMLARREAPVVIRNG